MGLNTGGWSLIIDEVVRLVDSRPLEKNTSHRRWVAALILVLIVPLAIGFNTRLSAIQRIHDDELRLRQQVADEQARHEDLERLSAYVASDAYVEHWARVDARMAKPGEVAVIPVASEAMPADSSTSATPRMPSTILDEWWAIFFEAPVP